ncbi:MAG: DUF3649 domain-containing protein [Steroidobacteraceae bacterium]
MSALLANEDVRYRLGVAARVLVAVAGGYAVTALTTVLLALIWPVPKAQSVLAADMLSFALYVVVVIWAFAVRSLIRVWAGIAGLAVVLALLVWWLLPPGSVP